MNGIDLTIIRRPISSPTKCLDKALWLGPGLGLGPGPEFGPEPMLGLGPERRLGSAPVCAPSFVFLFGPLPEAERAPSLALPSAASLPVQLCLPFAPWIRSFIYNVFYL